MPSLINFIFVLIFYHNCGWKSIVSKMLKYFDTQRKKYVSERPMNCPILKNFQCAWAFFIFELMANKLKIIDIFI